MSVASRPGPRGAEAASFGIDPERAIRVFLNAFATATEAPTCAVLSRAGSDPTDATLVLRGLATTDVRGAPHISTWPDRSSGPSLGAPSGSVLGRALVVDDTVVGQAPPLTLGSRTPPRWWIMAAGMHSPVGDRGVIYAEFGEEPAGSQGLRELAKPYAAVAGICIVDPALSSRDQVELAVRAAREARCLALLAGPTSNGDDPFGSLVTKMVATPAVAPELV